MLDAAGAQLLALYRLLTQGVSEVATHLTNPVKYLWDDVKLLQENNWE